MKQDGGDCDKASPSLKVIADPIRACSFTVVDGVMPGNEGRGYVLRRIARRAIRHGYKLGARTPFFHKLVAALVAEMGDAYPELRAAQARVTEVLQQEEERFFKTIATGMELLESALAGGAKQIDGETAFKLHDTFGFPVDLTADVCRERGLTVDEAGFNRLLEEQKQRGRQAGKFKMAQGLSYTGVPTQFHGYEHLVVESVKVVGVYVDGSPVNSATAGDDAVVVLDQTPFYAESGGQVGDTGELRNGSTRMLVEDTIKIQADVFGHHGRIVEGSVRVGDSFVAKVDVERRAKTVRNHSATHLMHKALREVLGAHVQQKGSLVNPERTRFDFAHTGPMTDAQIRQVEAIVNAEVLANAAANAQVMAIDDAQKSGAMMLFGEKYGDEVRVLTIGSSKELCGGTHVQRTGDIGLFKVVAESGVAAGIRRVEAITGDNALAYLQSLESTVDSVAGTPQGAARRGARAPGRRARSREVSSRRRSRSSRASWPRRKATSWCCRRSTSRASRYWPPSSTAPMPRRCATRWTNSRTSSRPPPSCWRRSKAPRCSSRPASLPMPWARSRPASWSTSSPSRWAARAAASPTWPWPAAPTRPSSPARSPAFWAGCRNAPDGATMRLTRFLPAVTLALAATLASAAEAPAPVALSAADDALIRDLEAASWVAWKNHDATFFERFLSDDHVEVHAYGLSGKAAVVDGVRSPACVVQAYTLSPFTLTPVSADTVLVTYRAEQDTTCGTQKVPSPVWATSVYAKRNGRWVNVLYQHTAIGHG